MAAGLADHLVEMADAVAVLAQPGVGKPQGVEFLGAAVDVDGEAHADGRGLIGLAHQEHLSAVDLCRARRVHRGGRSLGQPLKIRQQPVQQGVVVGPAQAHHHVVPCVVGLVELLDVIQGDGLQAGHRADVQALVRGDPL